MFQGSISLFDGGARYANIREAQTLVRQESYKLAKLDMELEAEIRGNLADIENKKHSRSSTIEGLKLAQSLHDDTMMRLALGMATHLDIIDTNHDLFKAEVANENATQELFQSRLALAYVLGDLKPALVN